MQRTIITGSPEQTEALGNILGQGLQAGDVIALTGDLGAGKTCLTRGIARGLGIDEAVTSPTFILVSEYTARGGIPLIYVDCYRLDNAAPEAVSIGLDELLDEGSIAVVEWAERIASLLPDDRLDIIIDITGEQTRTVELAAKGPRSTALLAGLALFDAVGAH